MNTGNWICRLLDSTCGLTKVQASRNNMNRPKEDCRTGRLKKRALPHNRNTAETATQHCRSMKMVVLDTTSCIVKPRVNHRA